MSTQTEEMLPSVKVSDEATRALLAKARQWSGWSDARLLFGQPVGSPWARCDLDTHLFTVNVDSLILNPHRVLLTVTPFRLRQEAVLTGTMLHEAGHARFSKWIPEDGVPKHSDGTEATKQTSGLARLCEEARIEGLMAGVADTIGAEGLAWTMRASCAALIGPTELSDDSDQQVMDVLSSWVLRAGRAYALYNTTNVSVPQWAHDFTSLLLEVLRDHLDGDNITAQKVIAMLLDMIRWDGNYHEHRAPHHAPFMLDTARDILAILFPDSDGGEDSPQAGEGMHGEQGEGEQGATPSTEDGDEGDAEPEDGTGDDAADDEGDEQDSDEGEGGSAGDEAADEGEQESSEPSLLAERLAELEEDSNNSEQAEAQAKAAEPPPAPSEGEKGSAAGNGEGRMPRGFRAPLPEEREVSKAAGRFLRDLINPSESSKMLLTESPSATVDAAALSAWRAGGQVRDPMFFRRVRRETQPTPPVKIAVLVDVSASMDVLQEPSALLSWALANAAIDLRNFAGRGVQVESTLIHWGTRADVIQANGSPMPGIKTNPCDQGTSAMHKAHDLVEEQMPGFFSVSDKPENRLLVHFTDWQMSPVNAQPQIHAALMAGVNILTVVPGNYSPRYAALTSIMDNAPASRPGHLEIVAFNPMMSEAVWEQAARMLTNPAGSSSSMFD